MNGEICVICGWKMGNSSHVNEKGEPEHIVCRGFLDKTVGWKTTSSDTPKCVVSGGKNISEKIEISIDYAKNIHKVLENHVSMGFEMVSQEIKDVVSEEAYKKLQDIFYKYHNANCGPFNRTLKKLIEEAEEKSILHNRVSMNLLA